MPTCPNCGSIVMNGDPYCPHCGTTFRWSIDSDDSKYGEGFSDDELELLKDGINNFLNDPDNLDWVNLKIGNDYLDSGEYLGAYVAFKKCIELNPKQDLAWAFMGLALIKLGDIDDANYCFLLSLTINPNNKYANEGVMDIRNNNLKNEGVYVKLQKDFESFIKSISNDSNIDNSSNLDKNIENQERKNVDFGYNYVHVKSSVKFKLCESCGKKVNKSAKKCPYCNGTSFSDDTSNYKKDDNVKFCPSCHNRYYDSNFCINCGDKLISKSEYEEIIKKEKQDNELELKDQKICPFCLNDGESDGNFCTLCGGKLLSKWDFNNLMKKLRIGDKQKLAQRFKSIKESEKQNRLKEKFGIKDCPVCKQEIPKNAVRCIYCKTILKQDTADADAKSNEALKDWFICLNCGKKFNQRAFDVLKKCPYCGASAFKTLVDFQKEQPIESMDNFDYCENCSTYIPNDCECCPYCESNDIKRRVPKPEVPKHETNNYKSRLKVKETSNDGLNYCKNCCTYISKDNEYCPHCGSTYIEKY